MNNPYFVIKRTNYSTNESIPKYSYTVIEKSQEEKVVLISTLLKVSFVENVYKATVFSNEPLAELFLMSLLKQRPKNICSFEINKIFLSHEPNENFIYRD